MKKGKKSPGISPVLVTVCIIAGFLLVIPAAEANRSGMSFTELKAPPSVPLLPGQASGTYPVGFYGLLYNVNNDNMLEIDLGAAQTVNAEVTPFSDRVEVYQHSSPAVLITFHGSNFDYSNGKLVGKVTSADFVTSPLVGNVSQGDVTGSIRVQLFALNGRADCINMFDANVTADLESQFSGVAATENLDYSATAFTFNITKVNLDNTGSANLTFTVPSAWVATHGGVQDMYFMRMSDKDKTTRLLASNYLGEDNTGAMKFMVRSPNGTSVFGLIAAKAQLGQGKEPPAGQLSTDVGMFMSIPGLISSNIILIGVGIVALGGIVYFGRVRTKKEK